MHKATAAFHHSLCKEDPVTLAGGVDANIVFGLGRVRSERLNDEGVESTGGLLNGHRLACTPLDPFASDLPILVEAEEASLSSSLNQLIGFADKFGREDPFGKTLTGLNGRGEGVGRRVPACQHRLQSGAEGSERLLTTRLGRLARAQP